MTPKIFSAEDFTQTPSMKEQHEWEKPIAYDEWLAMLANRRFEAWLKEQPVVYGHDLNGECETWNFAHYRDNYPATSDTHTARLVCIEEIKREPCKHEPRTEIYNEGFNDFRVFMDDCKHCGVKLVAEWKAAE